MGKRTSTLWRYFDYVDLREFDGEVYANCKYCPRGFDLKRTNCMWSHLKRNHKHVYPLALEDHSDNIKRQRKGQPEDISGKRKKLQSTSVKPPSSYPKSKKKSETPGTFLTINDDSDDEEEMAPAPSIKSSYNQPLHFTHKVIRGDNASRLAYSQQETPSKYQELKETSTETPKIFFTINNDSEDEEGMVAASPTTKNQRSPFTQKVIHGNSNIVSVLNYRRDAYSPHENIFLLAVAAELQNMSEDCKDVVKAEIWQVVCKVKQSLHHKS